MCKSEQNKKDQDEQKVPHLLCNVLFITFKMKRIQVTSEANLHFNQ